MKRPRFAPTLLAASLLGAAGCNPGPAAEPPLEMVGELSIELRDKIEVRLGAKLGGGLAAKLTLRSGGYGVLSAGQVLEGEARIEDLPEAGALMYVARLSAPAVPSGPCEHKPISLSLSLVRRGAAPRVAGSLAARCDGGDASNPVRMLRLSGALPPLPPSGSK